MSRRAAVGGVSIAYDVIGPQDAPALVLLHSLGQDWTMWDAQVPVLSRDHLVLSVDLRGHGGSDVPAGPYSVAMLAGDVLAAVSDAGIESFHVCGVSLGGLVAQRLAIDARDRVRSLVAANTAARIGSQESWQERIDLIGRVGMDGAADTIVPLWFAPGFREAQPEMFSQAVGVFRATSPEGYTGCCAALAEGDLEGEVGTISVPTLVIGGDLDRATTLDGVRRLHDSIPRSELTILPGAAHLSNLDAADAFTARVASFLDTAAS